MSVLTKDREELWAKWKKLNEALDSCDMSGEYEGLLKESLEALGNFRQELSEEDRAWLRQRARNQVSPHLS